MNNQQIEGELWVDVRGYKRCYSISNMGRLKSLDRTIREQRTKRIVKRLGKLLSPCIDSAGYYITRLGKRGVVKTYKVHRLVALHFVSGHTKNKWVTNHVNGNKLDNRASNLEWCTVSDNLVHAYKLGLKKPALGSKVTKLDTYQIKSIKHHINNGARTIDIARAHSTTTGIVRSIKSGRTWKHISV